MSDDNQLAVTKISMEPVPVFQQAAKDAIGFYDSSLILIPFRVGRTDDVLEYKMGSKRKGLFMDVSLLKSITWPGLQRDIVVKFINRLLVVAVIVLTGERQIMAEQTKGATQETKVNESDSAKGEVHTEEATFGSGCFWCTEAVFQQLKGVKSVVSGYSGGRTKNPNYEQVCTGTTGHAEVIQVTFDPQLVSYPELLEVFWKTHDPTTLNQQGADRGTQYRSVIFYHNENQKKLATEYMKKLDASGAFTKPIVTEISPMKEFYPGEAYHQNYFRSNPENRYCTAVIKGKVEKFRAVFKDKLK